MAFEFIPELASSADILASINEVLTNPPHSWEEIFSSTGSFNFNTVSGVENTTNDFFVLRKKLIHNGVGGGDDEYSYAIFEDDAANSRILLRCCVSFSSGGVNVDVTPLAAAITNGSLANISASHGLGVFSSERGLGIGLDNGSSIENIFLSSVDHVLGDAHPNKDQFYAIFKSGVSSCWIPSTTTPGKQMPISLLQGTPTDTIKDGNTVPLLSPGVIVDSDELFGVLLGVYFSSSSIPTQYDLLEVLQTPPSTFALLRVFKFSSGIIALRE